MTTKPRIVCLDDEQLVLDGLQRFLRVTYDVATATKPQVALDLLARSPDDPVQVLVSDMRMPEMNGIEFLKRARKVSPDTTRILLTGDADTTTAAAAINEGNVFRFVLKPCPAPDLRAVIGAAAEQHRLIRSERQLLAATLTGCVEALMDTLSIAEPEIFSRAGRLRRLVSQLCPLLEIADAWQVEMAAQLGDIGAITLPPSAIAALESGRPNSPVEAQMLAQLPRLADGILARIPRLEQVRELVRQQVPTDRSPMHPLSPDASEGARLLQLVREYDALVWRGMPANLAVTTLGFRRIHSRRMLLTLAEVAGMHVSKEAIRKVQVGEMAVGDELVDNLYSAAGDVLVSRGQILTEQLLVRLRNYERTVGLRPPILVIQG